MLKPSVDTPIVFTIDQGNGTSEVAAIASSPFTLTFIAPNGEIKEVSSEINSDHRHIVAEIVPNGTKVEVLQ